MIKNIKLVLKLFIISLFSFSLNLNSKTIIFNFEGTIADSKDFEFQNAKEALFKRGFVTYDDIENYRNLSSEQIIEELKLAPEDVSNLTQDVLNEFAKKMSEVKPIKGIEQVLSELKQAGHTLGIMTNTPKDVLKKYLEMNDLIQYFDESYFYTSSLININKHESLDKFVTQKEKELDDKVSNIKYLIPNMTPTISATLQDIVYVCDRVADAEGVLNSTKVHRCILVGDDSSYNSFQKLSDWIEDLYDNKMKADNSKSFALIRKPEFINYILLNAMS